MKIVKLFFMDMSHGWEVAYVLNQQGFKKIS